MTTPKTPADEPEATILRENEIARVKAVLEPTSNDKVHICAISGAGGVGKTFLVDHTISVIDLEHSGYVKLAADGLSAQLRADFIGLVDQKFAIRTLHPPARPGKDYFPSIRTIADAYASLLDEAERELQGHPDSDPTKKQVILALLKGGQILNKLSPKTKGLLDFSAINLNPSELDSSIDASIEAAKKLEALAVKEQGLLPRQFRQMIGMTLRNRIRRELHAVTADYLFSDLCTFVGRRKTVKKLGIKIPGQEFSRLLIVLDDFEVLGPVLADFIFANLLPKLENADFPSTLIVVGRDDFAASNPDWSYRYSRYFRDQIRLAPFSREQAMAYLKRMNITDEEAEQLYKYTEGFPFLLKLVCDERGSVTTDNDSQNVGAADIPRQFFDRTTRWMSNREVEWFKKVVYLDKVNLDTLSWFFPANEIDTIMYWFEREGSIRDPRSKVFTVRGLIREKVLKHLAIRHPSEHKRNLDLVGDRVKESERLPV